VYQGALLVQIDSRPYQAALSRLRGSWRKTRPRWLMRGALCCGTDPCTNRASSRPGLRQSAVGGWPVAGLVKSDQANIEAATVQLAYCRITAPITGRIGLRLVDLGNIVHAADTTGLAVITQLQQSRWTSAFPKTACRR